MQRYFVAPSQIQNDTVRLLDQDAFHATQVMRMTRGETFQVADNTGLVATCVVSQIAKKEVLGTVTKRDVYPKPMPSITVGQALIRREKYETVLQKATELGADKFLPLLFSRSIIKLEAADESKKRVRHEAILKEASEQSERAFLPVLEDPLDIRKLDPSGYGTILVAHARENESNTVSKAVSSILWDRPILFVVGPEGGIDDAELAYLDSIGAIRVSLGPRILRSETAPLYLLSVLHAFSEARP